MTTINPDLRNYVEAEILPRYDAFDPAHRRDHVEIVIGQSMELAEQLGVDADMAYVVAAYHDTGICEGRELHHVVSGRIIREDVALRRWFTDEQIAVMAEAAEDHRASARQEPRTVYGRIVAEADRFIDAEAVIRRTIQYGIEHYPALSCEEHYRRMLDHLHEKYDYGGYLRLWFPHSPNAERLEQLRQIIKDEPLLHEIFLSIYKSLTN